MSEQMVEIPIGKLLPNRTMNPRKDLRELEDLVASVKKEGILVPLTVEPFGANYRIVAGHRRLAAGQRVGLTTLPCIVRRYTEDGRLDAMLVDNIQRNDLNPIEEASAYEQLLDRGLNQKEIAERIGKSQAHVSKRLQLLQLPINDRRAIAAGKLSQSEALGYLRVESKGPEFCRSCGRKMPKKAALV